MRRWIKEINHSFIWRYNSGGNNTAPSLILRRSSSSAVVCLLTYRRQIKPSLRQKDRNRTVPLSVRSVASVVYTVRSIALPPNDRSLLSPM